MKWVILAAICFSLGLFSAHSLEKPSPQPEPVERKEYPRLDLEIRCISGEPHYYKVVGYNFTILAPASKEEYPYRCVDRLLIDIDKKIVAGSRTGH